MSSSRKPAQGMLTIARFNWPLYLAAGIVLLVSLIVANVAAPRWIKETAWLIFAGAAYFGFVSLAVSFLIYDRSDLYRWNWLKRALDGSDAKRIVLCHSGLDEVSKPLHKQLPDSDWIILDHFDPQRMTEPSIQRARRLFPPSAGTITAPYDCWPIEDDSIDLVFALLAVHELRTEGERTAWMREASRCLQSSGRVVIAEHVRDLANFLAFGPGFLHFHSIASWRRCWEAAGFRFHAEIRLTPWIRVFVLTNE